MGAKVQPKTGRRKAGAPNKIQSVALRPAKNRAETSSSVTSSSGLTGIALARSRLTKALTTYPIRLAAPRYAAWEAANQCSLTSGGISGLKANRDRPMPTRLEHRPAVMAPVILAFEARAVLCVKDRSDSWACS
jgi:hypothetical protein